MSIETFIQSLLEDSMSERGNNLFVTNESSKLAFFSKVSDTQYFQFAYTPCNYPTIESNIIDLTDAELTEHINSNFVGWHVSKCNVEGIKIDNEGCVAEIPAVEIHWGEAATRAETKPELHVFDSDEEAEAFIEGADFAIESFPNDVDASEHDFSGYSESEQKAFLLALEAGNGFSDYELGERTSSNIF